MGKKKKAESQSIQGQEQLSNLLNAMGINLNIPTPSLEPEKKEEKEENKTPKKIDTIPDLSSFTNALIPSMTVSMDENDKKGKHNNAQKEKLKKEEIKETPEVEGNKTPSINNIEKPTEHIKDSSVVENENTTKNALEETKEQIKNISTEESKAQVDNNAKIEENKEQVTKASTEQSIEDKVENIPVNDIPKEIEKNEAQENEAAADSDENTNNDAVEAPKEEEKVETKTTIQAQETVQEETSEESKDIVEDAKEIEIVNEAPKEEQENESIESTSEAETPTEDIQVEDNSNIEVTGETEQVEQTVETTEEKAGEDDIEEPSTSSAENETTADNEDFNFKLPPADDSSEEEYYENMSYDDYTDADIQYSEVPVDFYEKPLDTATTEQVKETQEEQEGQEDPEPSPKKQEEKVRVERLTPQDLYTTMSVSDEDFGDYLRAFGPNMPEKEKLTLAATCESDIAGTNPLAVEYAYDEELDMYGILVYIHESNKYWFITEGSATYKETLWHLFTRDRLKITANYSAVLNYISKLGIKPTNLVSLTALYGATHVDISRLMLNNIVKAADTSDHTIKRYMSKYAESYTNLYTKDIERSERYRKCLYYDNLVAYSFDISDLVDTRKPGMITTNYKKFEFTYTDDMEKIGNDNIITYLTNQDSLFGINPEDMYWNVIKRINDNHMFTRFSIRILEVKENELTIACPQHLTKNISDAIVDYIKKSAKKLNKQVIPQINISYK